MSETEAGPLPGMSPANTPTCSRCQKSLAPEDRVWADDRIFCRSCYETLKQQLGQIVEEMSTDINYPLALTGAVLGGALGALIWWGFTVLTRISFGLVAVVIGYLVAQGSLRLSGFKRSQGLQVASTAIAVASFVVATYLVNATFVNRALEKAGRDYRVPFFTTNLGLIGRVLSVGFGFMDVVFLGIVVWETWKMTAPFELPPADKS